MNKLLIISGPTATGKTALAVELAKKFNGELVSTDSCQIYRGMDIGTGKDQPNETPIHLIDVINPDEKFSVSQFKKIALVAIKEIQSRHKLPILVGCSGFYTDSIVNPGYETFAVKPNKLLRFFLNKFSVSRLQKIYKFLDKENFKLLNNSDINNPHRLIRKIEIKFSKKKNKAALSREVDPMKSGTEGLNFLHISLTAPMPFLYDRIDKRVHSRIDEGFLAEVENLLKKYKWSDPGMQIGAYQCLKPYFEQKTSPIFKGRYRLQSGERFCLKNAPFCKSKILFRGGRCPKDREVLESVETPDLASLQLNNCLQKWKYAEHSDARRQSTFFKTKSNATFFNITDAGFSKKIITFVSQWYNKS